MNWAIIDDYGIVIMKGSCPIIDETTVFPSGGVLVIDIPPNIVPEKYYIEGGVFKKLVDKPGDFFNLNRQTKGWELDEPHLIQYLKDKRDTLLRDTVDRINPIWWECMGETQKQSWISYRQALLDISLQEGYPVNVVWPIPPILTI